MLAYASQGSPPIRTATPAARLASTSASATTALTDFGELPDRLRRTPRPRVDSRLTARSSPSSTATPRDAQAALQLVLAQPAISSQLIDNLNASIHLRALLTDLFLIDEVLKTHQRQA